MAGKKDKILMVRMTEQEWQALKAYAETEDCSMAAVIRKLLKKLPKTEPVQNDEK
jgi:predicted DNA-binding ribbon-helix-helix protein